MATVYKFQQSSTGDSPQDLTEFEGTLKVIDDNGRAFDIRQSALILLGTTVSKSSSYLKPQT